MTQHLYLRGSNYYFNRRIRDKVLRISLRTNQVNIAREKAAKLYLLTNRCLRTLMTHDEIKYTARLKAKELHDEWLNERINKRLSDGDLEQEIFNDEVGESVLKEEIGLNRLNENQLLDAYTDLMFIALKRRHNSQLRNTEDLLLSTETAPTQNAPEKLKKILKISSKIEEFISDKKATKSSIREDSLTEYRIAIQELIDILGDINVLDIRYEQATTYRNTIKKLPKHRKTSKSYKSKTIQELLGLEIPEANLLSAKTINGKLSLLSSYFEWLEQYEVIKKNPFKNLRIEASNNHYNSYTSNDLKIIFSSPLFIASAYSKRKTTNQSHWWLIVLAAFTGARIGELMQMRLEDITETDGVLSMAVTDEGEGMSVKTSAGKRKFPVPPILIELGLMEYIEDMKKTSATTLLAGIPLCSRKAGSIASKWFGRYKKNNLPNSFSEENKVFHSFRHTFISNALTLEIELPKLQQIVGHEPSLLGETATYKGEGYSQKQLLLELNKFKYENLDLSKLKNDWKRLRMTR